MSDGLWFIVWHLCFFVNGVLFMVYGFRVSVRVSGFEFRVPDFGFRVLGSGFRISGFGFQRGTHKTVKARYWSWLPGEGRLQFQVVPFLLASGTAKSGARWMKGIVAVV